MKYLKYKELMLIIIIYLFVTINLITNNAILYTNVINPLFWGCVILYLILNIKKYYIRFSKNKKYVVYMVIMSSIHIVIFFYLGFIFGFSKSPYKHNIISILRNSLVKLLPVIGIELTRYILVTTNKKNKLLLTFLTILFILIETNYNTIINLFPNKEELFKYICSSEVPLIACGMLYTYLTLKGSYLLPLIYRIFKELVVILLPILPDIDWFVSGSACILSPVLIYVLFKFNFIKENNDIRKKQERISEKISYIITIILCVTLICFMLGVFKYEPIAILSNSMITTFNRGDVVIFKKLSEKELKNIPQNTIIIYSIDEQNIAHRIVNKIEEDDTVFYQTKGDYNNAPDTDLVRIEQIKGIYMFHIKYVGFPSIWLYDYFNNERSKVEIK